MQYYERKHVLRLLSQQEEVKRIFDRFARNASRILEGLANQIKPGEIEATEVWVRNKEAERDIDRLLSGLHADLMANIDENVRAAWEDSNLNTDAMITEFIKGLSISETVKEGLFRRNGEALNVFLKRKIDGLDLSARVWKVTESAKENLSYYLASGIAEGRSAALISQDIRYSLKNPDKRFRRIRNSEGRLVMSQPMKLYKPGVGVYRSSFKNALRVSATETNTAYHEADFLRWENLAFVVGIKVDRSPTAKEPCKICDSMKGTYPKGFKFLPWHPFCICQAVPVMLSGDEFADYVITGQIPQSKVVKDMPENAIEYAASNESYRKANTYKENRRFFEGKK